MADSTAFHRNTSIIIRKIKEIAPGLPVVLIKARKENKSPRAFENTEADLVIGAPLDMDRVPRLISRLLSNREALK